MNDIRVRAGNVIVSVLCMIAIIMLLPLTQVAAGSIPETNVSIDYESRELWIDVSSNTEIFYEVGKADAEPKSWESVKAKDFVVKTINGVEKKIAVIDIGWVPSSKDNYLYIKGNVDQDVTKLLLPKKDKLKVTFCGKLTTKNDASNTWKNLYSAVDNGNKKYPYFNDDTGCFIFTINDNPHTDLSTIQWKKGAIGKWKALSQLNLSYYKAKGASLFFRVVKENGAYSNEATVKYAKQASTPSATVDGGKLTIALKTAQEYRMEKPDGSWTDWITPTFEGGKSSGKVKISELSAVTGGGITVAFADMKIKVRTKTTEKKIASKERLIEIPATTAPVSGKEGVLVKQNSEKDLTRGLVVINNSAEDYQYAVLDRKVSGTLLTSAAAIESIDLSASSNDDGYVRWSTVKAGKSGQINYSKYKKFEDSYLVVIRKAPVKEDNKKSGIQFRLASTVLAVGDAVPVSDTASETFTSVTYPVSKTVNFTLTDSNTELWTSLNEESFSKNTTGKVEFTVKEKGKFTIWAYTKNKATEEVSRTLCIELEYK